MVVNDGGATTGSPEQTLSTESSSEGELTQNEPTDQYDPTDSPLYNSNRPDWFTPELWTVDTHIILYLNEQGQKGANLRNGPGIMEYSVIEILWDNDQVVFLHSFFPDTHVDGLYWLHVLSPSGTMGYLSSQLVGKLV